MNQNDRQVINMKGRTRNILRVSIIALPHSPMKGVILNFWGTWCKPCREEMPDMNDIYTEGHEDYEIVAVNVGENEQQIRQLSAHCRRRSP